ncbi:MAG: hypothetical protein Q7S95_01610 [bacterium]|nr:hypothetical protein [bacterium]
MNNSRRGFVGPLLLVIVAILLVGGYFVLKNTKSVVRELGAFTIAEFRYFTPNPSFCGKWQITRKSDNLNIATLLVCEDNIDSVRTDGDWVIVETDAGRSYRKNLITGEDEIQNAGGVGGLSKVE